MHCESAYSRDCCSGRSLTTVRDKVNNSTSSQNRCIFQLFCSRTASSFLSTSWFEVVYSGSQCGVSMCTASAHYWRSGFLCRSSSSTPPTALSTIRLSLSLSFCDSISHPSHAPSLAPPFSPVSSANTVPCRVGHVMNKWLVRALCRTSYFIIRQSFPPLHSALAVSSSIPLSLSLFSFSLSVSVAPLFLLQPHARGRLKLCEGKKRKRSAAISTVRASPQPALP